MCFEFTAYTHLRRPLLLRMLCEMRSADVATIMQRIGMSQAAASRQTSKLARRGLVRQRRSGTESVVENPKVFATAFRASLFGAVRNYLMGLAETR